jgi:hypothetical protein
MSRGIRGTSAPDEGVPVRKMPTTSALLRISRVEPLVGVVAPDLSPHLLGKAGEGEHGSN